jgi:hypothetical protein
MSLEVEHGEDKAGIFLLFWGSREWGKVRLAAH